MANSRSRAYRELVRFAAVGVCLSGAACTGPSTYGAESGYVRIERLDPTKYVPKPLDDTYRVILGPKQAREIGTQAAARKTAQSLSYEDFMVIWRDYARDAALTELRRRGFCTGAAELKAPPTKVEHGYDIEVVMHCAR
jgi:hypothetical protein